MRTETSTPRAGGFSRKPVLRLCLPERGSRIVRPPLLTLLVVGWALAVPRQANADVIYNVIDYPTLQNGYTVTGTITTDGTIGAIGPNDITNWDVTISLNGVTDITFNRNSPNAGITFAEGVTATATSITVPQSSFLGFRSIVNGAFCDIDWPGPDRSFSTYNAEDTNGTLWSSSFPAPYTVATTAAAVPEPSTAALAALGAFTLLAYRWHRHRSTVFLGCFLVGSSRVDLQACKLEYSIVSPK